MSGRVDRREFIKGTGLTLGAIAFGSRVTDAFGSPERFRYFEAGPVDLKGALKYTSGKRFPGAKVVVVAVSGDQGEWIGKVAKTWENATGASVDLNLIPFTSLQDKVLLALSTNVFLGDLLNVPAFLDGDLMGGGYIESVPAAVSRRLNFADVMPLYRQQGLWNGVRYGYPWDGDVHSMYYRKDLINDPSNRSKFSAKYHQPLRAPRTWEEWHNVGEFFTNKPKLYGAEELVMPKNQGYQGIISRAAPYSKIPGNPAFLFDPETMKAEIANPGFVQAITDLKAMMPYMPPGILNYGFSENAQAIAGGHVVLDIQWGDIGPISVDPKQSVVRGKIGFALTPGVKRVWDSKKQEWVSFPHINYAPYAAFGGWQNLVAKNAKQKAAAIDLASYLASPQVMLLSSVTGGSGVNPARLSTIHALSTWVKAGFPTAAYAKEYLNTLLKVQTNKNAIFQLRLPGFTQYSDALELAVSKVLAGQASPKAALDEAAKSWDATTQRIGRSKQLKLYRESLGLKS